jgi:multidrug efflux pump subunit AcrB
MWIVRLALRRPYTFLVAAILVAILGIYSIVMMPTDIFPNIDIPVVSVIFNYTGMTPPDIEGHLVTILERSLTTTVNDIEHIESQSLNGVGVVKVFFQKGAKVEAATAQLTAIAQTAIRGMPPGTQPPLIIRYSASNVPILQLSISSDTLSEQQLFDTTVNLIRPQLVPIPGLQMPYPYGGKMRQIMVDLDPERLYAWGISPSEVSDAVNAQNVILPSGTAKIGTQEYPVSLNGSPLTAAALNDVPIKTVRGTTVYLHDIAQVRDGFSVQTNMVHANGKRGILLTIYKSGGASTLAVVSAIRAALPRIEKGLPPDLHVELALDQSLFVRAAVWGVIKEAGLAAGLTGLMILLFLGSWRSTLIVMISIPLSILVSIIVLGALGETLNVMTLGGMALAVGILVDDATVEIENIHRNLHQRKRLVQAILDGASQIAVPAFVSTLCICIVFVPVVFISGSAKFLFTPLAMAVVFAMLTSYLLSRTLVPTMVHYLLAAEVGRYGGVLDLSDPHAVQALATHTARAAQRSRHHPGRILLIAAALLAGAGIWGLRLAAPGGPLAPWGSWLCALLTEYHVLVGWVLVGLAAAIILLLLIARFNLIWRVHDAFDRRFEKFRRYYGGLLVWSLDHRPTVVVAFLLLVAGSCALLLRIGTDFFPTVDAGQVRLHVRAPAGTRIEETERYFGRVEDAIRHDIPAAELGTMLDNIGIPYSGINLSLGDGTMISPADGEVMLALRAPHRPTAEYLRLLRRDLARQFPDCTFFFQPADIATQVLNFGLSAPIDIQISGPQRNFEASHRLALQMLRAVAAIPGAADVRLAQEAAAPAIRVDVDRTLAGELGVNQRQVAGDLLTSLASSSQTAPNFWLDPRSGVTYNVMVQTPQYRIHSMADLENAPIHSTSAGSGGAGISGGQAPEQLLSNLAHLHRDESPVNITHYTIMPSVDVQASVQGTDLGRVAKGVRDVIARYEPRVPPGSAILLRGQVTSMRDSFAGLGGGLLFAVALVYLLMVINFQSWLDPLIILMALPGALAGILWMLLATGTTISVPALMGAIMSIGVATSNSILMITFANDQRREGLDARDAALAAGFTRLRPVVMTALAMIIGMLPMSLGLGEGGEQNAPLGRAVIGGLALATLATLFFVPVMYSWLRVRPPRTQVEEELK